jgi:predicted molibdopterin-dependent oxidoreductase YjgC
VAKITLNGVEIEAPDNAPLVEVIKQNGVWISNLCYVDGLVPYAGCRTCLVEIEGARGLQLACTTKVADAMVVNTELPAVKQARQQVLALINADHPDRCLTCHRRVKCMPGDICLRDDVVTHRCVTCSKNYRCELQSTNDLLDMGFENVQPWISEDRTYYQTQQPEPDRANPWLEFDPQMCILCTRCVRTCEEIRHTSAITLSNRGYTARIAFGSGGRVDESNCDFCGACIDVCPTATLMEKPNKWLARTEDWTTTTCNSCSVGCTISIGTRDGRAVIVKPDRVNPVSADQICVRGRFHYDAVRDRDRLRKHLVRRGAGAPQVPAEWGDAVAHAAGLLKNVISAHGAESVAVLGSPLATNEENYLAQKLAREVIGTPHVDFAGGAPNRAVARALEAAFGSEALPSDMAQLAQSDLVVVIADDLESSHNVAAMRIKDSIAGNPADPRDGRLVLVSSLRGEMADFAEPYGGVWLRPRPGAEAQVVDALGRGEVGADVAVPDLVGGDIERAREIIDMARDERARVAIVYAPSPVDVARAGDGARAAANLAIALRGEKAASCLLVLPTEANVNGARDMGIDPRLGPGRIAVRRPGMAFDEIVDAAIDGTIKGMIVVGDNPLMFAPDRGRVERALAQLDALVVIDGLLTDTAKAAHVVLADVPVYGKAGTYTNGERRLNRVRAGIGAPGDARPASFALDELANALGGAGTWSYTHVDDVTDEIAASVSGYDRFNAGFAGWAKEHVPTEPVQFKAHPIETAPAPRASDGELLLTTGRTLFTSIEGAAIHSPDADKLHRDEFVELHPADAAATRVRDGDEVTLATSSAEMTLRCRVSGRVLEGVAFVPSYHDGGAVMRLLDRGGAPVSVRVKVATAAT